MSVATYRYTARDVGGAELSGSIQGHDRHEVALELKQKGYYVLNVERQTGLSLLLMSGMHVGRRVTVKDKAVFTHQLATLLKAGMKLTSALKTLSRQTRNRYLRTLISQVHDDIERSSSLSAALAKHPRVFSATYTAIVGAAEQSGALAETLAVLSRQLKNQASVNARIKSALLYPVFLLAVSAMVVGILMTFVIPKFIELFVNANQALPLPTKILVSITEFARDSWWVVCAAAALLACTIITGFRDKRFKMLFDTMLLKLPGAGSLNRKLQLARFARTLGSLLDGGVRILAAIETTKGTTGNAAFSANVSDIEQSILKGSTLAEAMEQQEHFPELAANMVAVGEETGTLAEMLLEVAEMYDQESESAIASMTTLLGPLMIVILGLIIGFVVLAILMPIFETSTMIG
jgi:type II secretory pathway component PulF